MNFTAKFGSMTSVGKNVMSLNKNAIAFQVKWNIKRKNIYLTFFQLNNNLIEVHIPVDDATFHAKNELKFTPPRVFAEENGNF